MLFAVRKKKEKSRKLTLALRDMIQTFSYKTWLRIRSLKKGSTHDWIPTTSAGRSPCLGQWSPNAKCRVQSVNLVHQWQMTTIQSCKLCSGAAVKRRDKRDNCDILLTFWVHKMFVRVWRSVLFIYMNFKCKYLE